MDYQDAPLIKFDDKWKKNQNKMEKIYRKVQKEYERNNQREINKLRRQGYSDKEINELLEFEFLG